VAKINLKTKIRQLDGTPVAWRTPKKPGQEKGEEMELDIKMLCTAALLGNYDGENINGNEKAARCYLAMEIYKATTDIELTVEQVALLKDLIGRGFSSLIVGQSYRILDSAEKHKI